MLLKLTLILFASAIFTCFSCHPKSGQRANRFVSKDLLSGKVIGIIDGDTYDLLISGNQKIRIRMEGIDAPEKGMPFSKVSKSYLGSLCFNKIVRISITGKDSNNRYIGFTYLEDGTELSHEMIKAGLAWHFKKYNNDPDLAQLENEARNSKKGLWKDNNPISPWEIRSSNRKGISTKEAYDIKENQNQ
jgi:endonuclease YncB( thermonuclease family)